MLCDPVCVALKDYSLCGPAVEVERMPYT
jgi:hypothetical protein